MSGLALILITHNSARWLPAFFASWNTTLANAPELQPLLREIIIADSGSSDDSAAVARRLSPQARLLTCGHIGFAAAANRGIHTSAAPWFLLCNPDLTFSPLFAATFLDAILDPDPTIACFAPRLLNPDGATQPSVGRFPTIMGILRDQLRARPQRKYLHPQPQRPADIPWATAACLLLRRSAFDAIGGFDERYFLYAEEVDLQRRLADRAWRTHFIPEATLIHHHPAARHPPRPDLQRYAARGLLRYFAKFGPAPALLAFRLLALASLRLPPREALAPRRRILNTPTGP